MTKFGTMLFTNVGLATTMAATLHLLLTIFGFAPNLFFIFTSLFFITTYHDIWKLTEGG